MNETPLYEEGAPLRARRLLRELPEQERPLYRLRDGGPRGLSTTELLALMLGTPDALDLATELIIELDGIENITRFTLHEFQQIRGVGEAMAARLLAAAELGRRVTSARVLKEAPISVSAPADAANLLMSEMMHLEQEHLRLILLNTRNEVIATPTIYKGSLNASVVRIGELFRSSLKHNAAAMIVSHNHPSGDPSPSPEDIKVTRQIVDAGKVIDIDVLDHIIIGHGRFVSLKERQLGFD